MKLNHQQNLHALVTALKNSDQILPLLPREWLCKKKYVFDLSEHNPDIKKVDWNDRKSIAAFSECALIDQIDVLPISAYGERRAIHCAQFSNRCVHLGLDLSVPEGTAVFAPLPAKIHSFADNARTGDYGPTIILEHDLKGIIFYSLYGHLSRQSLETLYQGKMLRAGEVFATIGTSEENGGWPAHLHLQLITEIGNYQGDFPGVCTEEDAPFYLERCPDPTLLIPLLEGFEYKHL